MRVLHFYNWGYFAPITSGADVIASNQLEYFRSKGWEVDCLLLSDPNRSHQAEAFRERYSWVRSVQLIDRPPVAGDWSFRGQLSCYMQIARIERFRRLAREEHDLFFTNYVFTAPLLEPLPPGCKRLLEAVDFISDSFALNERLANPERDPLAPARDRFHRNVEMELFELFDGILFINEKESDLVGAEHPGRTHFVPPMMPWEHRPTVAAGRETASVTDTPFDLIFVGSNAPPNVKGLTAFYRQIFVPYLRKHRVRMAVIGKVCDQLDFDDWYVTKLGVVEGDLEEYYAQAKVVVIPILEGSGLSIKTIEGLARGRTVVTSRVGARGLIPDPDAFLQFDMVADPGGTAGSILDLLASEPLRRRMQSSAHDYYRMHFGQERYFNAMDSVMASLGIGA